MLDIKLIREKPDLVRQRLAARGAGDEVHVDTVLELDADRRKTVAEVERLKAERNRVSKEIGALMSQRKAQEAEAKKTETRNLGDRISSLDRRLTECDRLLRETLLQIPNLPHESVPVGGWARQNQIVRSWRQQPEYTFQPKTHAELCESLKLADFTRAAKLSGSGFVLYTNWGAKLERALIQFMLDLHTLEHGYTEVSPPLIIKADCMEGVGQFPKFRDQAYTVCEGSVTLGIEEQQRQTFRLLDEIVRALGIGAPQNELKDQLDKLGDAITVLGTHVSDLKLFALLPTAEAPVASIHREEILPASHLPISYVAYSPCFRAEAGAAGVGTRGMIRVHQFDKVELIKIIKPEAGYAEHEKMVAHAERVLQLLGLHYRVVLLCTGDMGFASAKTYDLEVWAPGQGSYLEVSSVSNCEDFQARRMNLRFKADNGENRFPHILNGSGTALARLFVALVETYQQADGSILIPAVLQVYLKTERISA